jgi:hypothetical protein
MNEAKELAAIRASVAKDCCKDPNNLVRHQERPEVTINTCQVCGCRHFRVVVRPKTPESK